MDFKSDQGFEQVFQQYYALLFNIGRKILNDDNAAEDIVQDVFLKLWANRQSISIDTNLKSYLHRAVINGCLNELEKRKRLQIVEDLPETVEPTTENKNIAEELTARLNRAISQLPPRMQVIFSLSRFEGLTNQEIADYLNISKKTVENQMGKALSRLRDLLK